MFCVYFDIESMFTYFNFKMIMYIIMINFSSVINSIMLKAIHKHKTTFGISIVAQFKFNSKHFWCFNPANYEIIHKM